MGGAQLAIDVTLRSNLTRDGRPRPRADWCDGAVAETAKRDKENKYPELLSSARCKLVVLAIELGGRFSEEAADFLRQLAAVLRVRVENHTAGYYVVRYEQTIFDNARPMHTQVAALAPPPGLGPSPSPCACRMPAIV